MEKIETGGPAFPVTPTDKSGQIAPTEMGLSKREYFAAAALTGMIGSGVITKEGESYREAKVRAAFEYADEMLKQSAQTEKGDK